MPNRDGPSLPGDPGRDDRATGNHAFAPVRMHGTFGPIALPQFHTSASSAIQCAGAGWDTCRSHGSSVETSTTPRSRRTGRRGTVRPSPPGYGLRRDTCTTPKPPRPFRSHTPPDLVVQRNAWSCRDGTAAPCLPGHDGVRPCRMRRFRLPARQCRWCVHPQRRDVDSHPSALPCPGNAAGGTGANRGARWIVGAGEHDIGGSCRPSHGGSPARLERPRRPGSHQHGHSPDLCLLLLGVHQSQQYGESPR